MKQTTNLVDEYADKSVDTNIGSQKHTQRLDELNNWNEEQAHGIAKEEGVELTEAHFEVIQQLRDYYLENGSVESGRELSEGVFRCFYARLCFLGRSTPPAHGVASYCRPGRPVSTLQTPPPGRATGTVGTP